MIDLHAHILPGLDDGARDLYDALEMADLAVQSGVEAIVATPHCQEGIFDNFRSERLDMHFAYLRSELEKARIPLAILKGMEVFASEDLPKQLAEHRLMSLNHSRYYLVEVPFDAHPDWIEARMDEVLAAGGVPIVAHAERYFCVQEDPALAWRWLTRGYYIQVNRGSIQGHFGEDVRRAAEFLVNFDLITCVASDAHRPDFRSTRMGEIRRHLERYAGPDYARRVLTDNPRRIVENRSLPKHGIQPVRMG